MAFTVRVFRRLAADAIYQWIAKRLRSGAANWYHAFLDTLIALERDAGVPFGETNRNSVLRLRAHRGLWHNGEQLDALNKTS